MRPHILAFFAALPALLTAGCDFVVPDLNPEPEPYADVTEDEVAGEEFILPPQPLPLEGSPIAYAMLRVANEYGYAALDREVGLDHRAARSILEFRAGQDGYVGTADDLYLDSIAQLDDLYWMGEASLWAIQQHALLEGLVVEELPEAECAPSLSTAIDQCLYFIDQAARGSVSADERLSSCLVGSEPRCPSSEFFAYEGAVDYDDPVLGYFELLCDSGTQAEICDLGIAGIASHLLPRCDEHYDRD